MWLSWSAIAIVTGGLLSALDVMAAPPAGSLRSFYIATGPGFDNESRLIVGVEPVGRDARVRVIRRQRASCCPRRCSNETAFLWSTSSRRNIRLSRWRQG